MLHIQKLNRTIFHGFGILLAAVLALPAASQANNLNISQTPLSIGGLTEPDVMFTIDDSGSMGWEAMPDAIANIRNTSFPSSNSWTNSNTYSRYYDPTSSSVTQIRSPNINTIFYNPAIRYYPWSNSNGSLMANADPTCAQYDPMAPNVATCVNFTIPHVVGGAPTGTVWPADYYVYNGGGQTTASNYTHVVIQPGTTYTTSANRTDCASAPTCTFTEEVQNYANWFQYYRERLMTAKAGISRAFAEQPTSMRVGYGSINTTNHTVDGVTTRTVISGVRHFDGTNRTNFFTNLFNQTTNGSTPLRQALEGVGQYFKRTDNAGPWGNTPGDNTDNTPHSTCRQVFNILMTDGYWNGNNPNYVTGNVDNSNGPTITMPDGSTYQYTPANPYKDSYSVTLADVAMYYWNQDLRTDLANNVPSVSAKDPAKWQHLVNFTVGLGVQGTLDSDPNSATYALPGLTAGTTLWPSASSNQIDDLWHAAVNSRGGYYSATNPDQFSAALSAAFADITSRTGSASAVSVTTATISASQTVFKSQFNSGDWSGDVRAYPINLATGVFGTQVWDAQTQITAQNWDTGRKIVTYVPGSGGKAFRWTGASAISATQQAALNKNAAGTADGQGQSRLEYLRGRSVPAFRSRPSGVLGDIVDSATLYVAEPSLLYPDNWGSGAPENAAPYSAFKTANASRPARIYVGANDGMLHVLDATTGNEIYAFVPNTVFPRLSRLTDSSYNLSHRYYVDGDATVADVFFSSDSAWHTVLVGTLRGGGQGVFALDITDPTAANEASAAAKVLWEFDDSSDADLGYTYSQARIVRMHNGQWAAVFGNGYNNMEADGNASTTGDSVLYILNVETGALIKKLDTGEGLAQSTSTPQLTNGMSTPTPVDVNQDSIIDYIYAGDLHGNIWKFDVTSASTANWKSSYLTASNAPFPLFVATDSTGARQPITAAVDVTRHPAYPGYMVYFGTGKYLELSDNLTVTQPTQTFYGVWDRTGAGVTQPTTSVLRQHLLQQQILQEVTTTGGQVRVLSNNQILWHSAPGLPTGNPPSDQMGWYLDLVNTGVTPLNNKGERVLTAPLVINGIVFFTTFLSTTDPCASGGGDSWLMSLSATTGGRLSDPAFDVNLSGGAAPHGYVQATIGGSTQTVVAGGLKSTVGALTGFAMTSYSSAGSGAADTAVLVSGGSGGGGGGEVTHILTGKPVQGRQSWIRLR